MKAKEELMRYLAGWRKGAACLEILPGEDDFDFVKGWVVGRDASREAREAASGKYGVTIPTYRPCGDPE